MNGTSPGPWTVEPCRSKHAPLPLPLVVDAYRARVAVLGSDAPFSNADANARLIAAGPELLAACRELSAWCNDDELCQSELPTLWIAVQSIRAAIESATQTNAAGSSHNRRRPHPTKEG